MNLRIVPIAEEHVPDFHRALDAVARERRFLAFLEAPPLEATRAFIINNIAKNNVQLVALSDSELVGWCDILPKDRPIYAHVGVLGIGILPAFRGRGLGAALIQAALDEASKRGIVRVELTVRAENTRAIALYQKLGFEREGALRDTVLVDGRYEDLVMMANVDRSRARPR
ncbi:MAG: GNAT family N-acetyltransferase [Methylobacteriaceae bacterium]|nr:GNAT family N-acetyltransferase [Methylobacteriaceae bacterium]